MTPTRLLPLLIGAAALLALGCSSSISPQLADARAAVHHAQQERVAQLNPDELREAERTLARAEAAPDGSLEEVDLAYVTVRQVHLARAHADAEALRGQVEAEEAAYQNELERVAAARGEMLEDQQDALADTHAALREVRAELEERGEVIDERTRELRAREAELAARVDELTEARAAQAAAEQRAADAMQQLREFAAVVEENGEMTITLNGEVLFETNESSLRSTAERRLNAVVEALREREDAQIVVEGHTDSRGSDSHNRALSRARANAVRRYLVRAGLSEGRIQSVGRGESEPVAENGTAEGRANNRRVEIIVRRDS